MKEYEVVWRIQVYASSPEEAAKQAATIAADCMDTESEARSFEVREGTSDAIEVVDLNELGRAE